MDTRYVLHLISLITLVISSFLIPHFGDIHQPLVSSPRFAPGLADQQDYVLSVAISPDGQWVVSGSKDRSIQFWNIASGQAQFMLQGHKNSVISIDLARSGGYLASGSGDCQARIWKYDPL
jgi:WD40 repeat protein